MDLIYKVKDRPGLGKTIVFAFQQVLAILAATIAVPSIVGNGMSQAAALLGAGVGTIVYLLFTKFRSPVFLGSSFAFIGSMFAAFAGAASAKMGFMGLIIGAAFAGIVYVVIAIIVKFTGVKWINKLMPAAVIGPTVSIIGLSLAGNAVSDLWKGKVVDADGNSLANPYIALLCGLITLLVVILCSVYGKKMAKLIPFIIGILAGYAAAAIFTVIGIKTNNVALQLIDFNAFTAVFDISKFAFGLLELPNFTFIDALIGGGFKEINAGYIATVAFAYVPVAFVVFAEHIADHKNLSSIIGQDLTEDPGLHRTLIGDGLATSLSALVGGPANTTYGENTGVLELSRVHDPRVIRLAAVFAVILSFIPKMADIIGSMPSAIIGGVSFMLYGMISAIGVRNVVENRVDLTKSRNLVIAAVILVCGLGFSDGLTFNMFGTPVTLTGLAIAAIAGILLNAILPGNDYEFGENLEGDINRGVAINPKVKK